MISAHTQRAQGTVIKSGGFRPIDDLQINAEAITDTLDQHVAIVCLTQRTGGNGADVGNAVSSRGSHDPAESLNHCVHGFTIEFAPGEARRQFDREDQIFQDALLIAIDLGQERPN